jgi:hypothetical protein
MAGITQEIPNYGVGGISQQPDQLKRPGQVKDAVNVIPDVIHGLYKRPGAERVGVNKLANVQTNGSYFHYHRDEVEGNYIGQIASDGTVRVWDCDDGAEKTVYYAAVPWVANTAYKVDDEVHNGANLYVCKTAGTSAGSGGPTGTGAGISDNTVTWEYFDTSSNLTASAKSYLTPSSATATEDIQALTINDTTFLNNRTKVVGTEGTTTARDHQQDRFAYVDLLRTENGRQYALNLFSSDTTTTKYRATKVKLTADDLAEGGGTGACNGIGTQVFTVTAAGSYSGTDTVEVKNSSGTTLTSGRDNLVFRLTINGQQGWVSRGGYGLGSSASGVDYECSYRREITLLHGGEGWRTGDTCKVEMTQALKGGSQTGGTTYSSGGYTYQNNDGFATYTIKVIEHEEFDVKGTINGGVNGILRPSPTPFDADTAVTADAILGGIQAELSGTGISSEIIGNGIYLYSNSDFSLEVVDLDLMRVTTDKCDDITKLPIQCKHNYIVQISNSRMSDEDDYWLRFRGQDGKDGAGTWTECAEPGIVKEFDPKTMPHILQRQADGTFLVKKFVWAERAVGDDKTNPIPSFNGKKINRVLSYANRLAFLSGENVTLSRPATFGKPDFFADTALTVSVIDPIDISSSSKYPADLFDGIEITTGLLLFSTNQQFLLSSDAEQLTAETAKLRAVSAFNYNKVVPPIYMGTSVAWLDNSNKYSRFVECADIAREGEPMIVETSKIVPTLLPKEINLVAESRDNSIILFGKTGDDTVIGYKYFNTAKQREQAAWFKWKHNEKLLYHFIVNDEYFLLDEDHFLQKINLIQSADDPSINQTDVGETTNFLLHLDNWTTIYGGVYNSTTKKTTFTHGTNSCVFNWQSDVPDPNGDLVLVDVNSATARVGRYVKAESISSGTSFVVEGDWATSVTSNAPLYIGYLYEYNVKFPRIYRLSVEGQNIRADTRASLVVHRIKLNFGKIGLYATTLDRVGKLQYTDVYESSDLDEYNVDDAPYLSRKIKTIPVYEKNENVTVTLKSSHPAPATLFSMAWEGAYSPKLYNRA